MKQYVVDAFTDKVFYGNPAAICLPKAWPSDELMQKMAVENNLSETAFAVKKGEKYHLRWFTPAVEINLCGHATLACSYVVLNYAETSWDTVTFETLSGDLIVKRKENLYEMDFPAFALKPVPVTELMIQAFGAKPREAYMDRDLTCVFDDETTVRNLTPDFDKVNMLDGLLLHATAQGKETDCVSRTFSPKCNVPEDPVCGSGHCHIVPYWANRLKKDKIVAYQASARGGTLYCQMAGNRVKLCGEAVLYSIAELNIDGYL
ncbi:MAG: PhzF family phenazine biosynthesis protein [Deltaproteobacteria bacterium]|jgi:predicted PhzF superfamily epimerase YddE/YHI9|nr:PhzF family phenazine biosynthesis protein [Deltaproteobacteria bacterium]